MNNNKGQTIIEVIFAISIVIIIILALVSMVTTSVANSNISKNKSLANKYLNEGLEAVKSIRYQGFDKFTVGAKGLNFDGAKWVFSGTSDTPATGFTRRVDISIAGAGDIATAIVTVEWQQGNSTFKSSASTQVRR